MTDRGTVEYRTVSRSCTIVGTGIAAVVALIFCVVLGALSGFGIVLFLALTWVLGQILARICAHSDEGDLFGLGASLGLHKAEREGKLSGDHLREQAGAKIAEVKRDAAATDTGQTIAHKAAAVADSVKEAAGAVKDKAVEVKEDAKGAVSSDAKLPEPADPGADATSMRPDGEDDLQRINGIGPQAAAKLKELGVTRFEQIANWTDEDIAGMDDKLGGIAGRIRRDDWVGQAKTLAVGG